MATRTIRRLDPQNPALVYMSAPDSVPPEDFIRQLETEAARLRALEPALQPGATSEPDNAPPSDRRELRQRMIRQGTLVDGDPRQAHHIVPFGGEQNGGRDPAGAQDVLRRYGIDINDPVNGVPLSRDYHFHLHSKEYYDAVNQLFFTAISRQDVEFRLRMFGRALQSRDPGNGK